MRLATQAAALAALAFALGLPGAALAQRADENERVLENLRRMDERREARARQEQALRPAEREALRRIPYGPKPAQTFDALLPERPNGAALLIALDTGWSEADEPRFDENALARRFLTKGYTVILARRRLWPEADPTSQALDLARALAAAQAKAPAWGVSPERFALLARGGGAHALALLAAEPAAALDLGAAPWAATVLLDPPAYDIERAMRRDPSSALRLAFGDNPDFWARASPARRLGPSPSALLAVCSAPRPQSCEQAREFIDRARQARQRAHMAASGAPARKLEAELGHGGELSERVEAFLRASGLP